jgi:cellulose biosynthesis protein BcsQ
VKVVASYSIKGGVGKTSAAVNLAFEAARTGVRVLVWDLDPQGGATYLLRVRPKLRGGSERLVRRKAGLEGQVRSADVAGVDVVPADLSLRHLDLHLDGTSKPAARVRRLLKPVGGHYDLVLLDCPPSISLSSESVFRAADELLVPVIPAALTSRTLEQLRRFLADLPDAPALVPFLSMVDRRRRLQREAAVELAEAWPSLLATSIPTSALVEQMGVERAPVGTFAPSAPVTRAYRRLWDEVAASLWPPD